MCEILELGEFYKIKEAAQDWNSIGGYEEVKERLREMVVMPLKFKEAFRSAHLTPHFGIFIWGPPKTGVQTLIAAAAKEAGVKYLSASSKNLVEADSAEHVIEHMFEDAEKNAPCILFIGDVEILAPRREAESVLLEPPQKVADTKITRKFFAQIDRIIKRRDVLIVASTHRVDMVDPALLRNGRIDRKIFLPAPDFDDRLEIFKLSINGIPLEKSATLEKLAEMTANYGASDLLSIPREAVLAAIKEKGNSFEKVSLKHFEQALKKVKPIERELIKRYDEIYKEECKHRYMY